MGKKRLRARAKAEAKAAAASKKRPRGAQATPQVRGARGGQTQDEDAQFEAALEELGVRVVGVAGDGNCMFRSIADQIEGNANSHRRYRAAVVDFIRRHREEFEPFMEDDEKFDDYVARMDTDAEWGAPGVVCGGAGAESELCDPPVAGPTHGALHADGANGTSTLHLSYHGEMHYNSVRSVDDPAASRRAAMPITPGGHGHSHSHGVATAAMRVAGETQRRRRRRTGPRVRPNGFRGHNTTDAARYGW